MGAKLASRGKNRGRRSRNVMADINVTPFVDVMLVLLVIFMVTAPLLTAGVSIDLPKTKAKAISQQDNKPIEISIDAQSRIYLGETRIEMEALSAKLQSIAIEAPDNRIYIKADEKLDYGKVMNLMSIVNSAGFNKIALVSDPTKAN